MSDSFVIDVDVVVGGRCAKPLFISHANEVIIPLVLEIIELHIEFGNKVTECLPLFTVSFAHHIVDLLIPTQRTSTVDWTG